MGKFLIFMVWVAGVALAIMQGAYIWAVVNFLFAPVSAIYLVYQLLLRFW